MQLRCMKMRISFVMYVGVDRQAKMYAGYMQVGGFGTP